MKNEEIIDQLVSLPENWDGYGAIPLFKEIGEKAKIILQHIKYPVDDIFPNPHGTITIDWRNQHNELLSLEIGLSTYGYFTDEIEGHKLHNGIDIMKDLVELENKIKQIIKR
jgi:hypothetical protein